MPEKPTCRTGRSAGRSFLAERLKNEGDLLWQHKAKMLRREIAKMIYKWRQNLKLNIKQMKSKLKNTQVYFNA